VVNKFIGVGNLTRDPDVITNGCKLSIALNYRDTVTYIKVYVLNNDAAPCLDHLTLGRKVVIEGRLAISKAGSLVVISANVTFL
jgi:single-stranded DNA-binding protein